MHKPPSAIVNDGQNESEELRRFRDEWKAEVKRRKEVAEHHTGSTQAHSSESSVRSTVTSFNDLPSVGTSSSGYKSSLPGVPSSSSPSPSFHVTTAPTLSQGSSSAVSIYREAVLHEQRGELEEALQLYRAAFRREAKVDILYEREEMLGAIIAQQIVASASSPKKAEPEPLDPLITPKVVLAGNGFTMEDLSKKLENTLAVQNMKSSVPPTEHGVLASRSLGSVLRSFPQELAFEPEDEDEPIHFSLLPDEMIIHILKILDPSSLERFASVNRKARVISLDSSIWRKLVQETYKPPQIPLLPDGPNFLELLSEQYLYDYRRLYIEHPRIRLDGVYIAVCHYIRPGLSENSWVNVTHLITYHRYLRFFPNGQVISLLTNEEQPPAHVIPLLKPTLRGLKGLFFGNWHLSGNTIVLSNLIDASSHSLTHVDFSSPASVADLLRRSNMPSAMDSGLGFSESPHGHYAHHSGHGHGHGHGHSTDSSGPTIRYIFTMNLTLLSRPLGRWNKMDIASYDSVNLETGEASPVALKHERPFWFSKVRSYALS
ncbi:hypothetical protein F5878DRAFT_601911 [Lentinula raphanica]|uniref:F-box domain-containing protein n=1 Tax=Lentinula raphanica TaxID=153919 RepID=A0AA38PK38_9AGAR|nr:hypothetical protein F5878DRAFT_601911 [Lentinula raphanica]